MKVLLNFANSFFRKEQQHNSQSALSVGGFDKVISVSPHDIDAAFARQHGEILNMKRGAGLWLWKPYFILQALRTLDKDDLLFYCDSGAEFLQSAAPLLDLPSVYSRDVIVFEYQSPERMYTKRDCFILMDCDNSQCSDSAHRLASFIIWRRSEFSLFVAQEYLNYCCDRRIISDDENVLGLDNYPGFSAHRHDQSVLSLLSKKHRLPAFRDPSQFGNEYRHMYSNSDYGQIINHYRLKTMGKLKRSWNRLFGSH